MLPSASPQQGFWTDYSRAYFNKYQILLSEHDSKILIAMVAVCLTLVSPNVFRICRNLVIWVLSQGRVRRQPLNQSLENNESRQRLLTYPQSTYETNQISEAETYRHSVDEARTNGPSNEAGTSESPVEASHMSGRTRVRTALEKSDSGRQLLKNLKKSLDTLNKTEIVKWIEVAPELLVAIIFFGLFVAWAIVGISSASISMDQAALSISEHCGDWQFDEEHAGDDIADLKNFYRREAEQRAGQYAHNCYNSTTSAKDNNPQSCDFFYKQSIPFNIRRGQPCPFHSSELCHGGLYSSIAFDTGYVNADTIGINVPDKPQFRRRTICSPLNMTSKYIRKIESPDTNATIYQYYYGSTEDDDFTLQTSGDSFQWRIPAYGVSPSFDPVFPAHEPLDIPDYRYPLYYNSDLRAGVFACADRTDLKLCSSDGTQCLGMFADPPPGVVGPGYWLMKMALEDSNTYTSIVHRMGSALVAQDKISQFVSDPLSDTHWEVEARQLFATSLARIQFDAWRIATGEGFDRAGFKKEFPDGFKKDFPDGNLCGLYKFKTTNFTNINAFGFFGFLFLAVVILVLDYGIVKHTWNAVLWSYNKAKAWWTRERT